MTQYKTYSFIYVLSFGFNLVFFPPHLPSPRDTCRANERQQQVSDVRAKWTSMIDKSPPQQLINTYLIFIFSAYRPRTQQIDTVRDGVLFSAAV